MDGVAYEHTPMYRGKAFQRQPSKLLQKTWLFLVGRAAYSHPICSVCTDHTKDGLFILAKQRQRC